VIIDDTTVGGKTKIKTGDDDDLIAILDSIFAELVKVNGGKGSDTFDGDATNNSNTYPSGSPVLKKIEVVVP